MSAERPVTLGIDIGVIKMIITHAAAVHGLDISPEPVDLARVALKRLGLIGKGTERDRYAGSLFEGLAPCSRILSNSFNISRGPETLCSIFF